MTADDRYNTPTLALTLTRKVGTVWNAACVRIFHSLL